MSLRRARARQRQERLLLGAVLVAVGLFGAWSRIVAWRDLDTEQRHLLDVQVLAIDQNLTRHLIGMAAALHGLRDDLPAWPGDQIGVNASRRLKALTDAMPGVGAMWLLDRDGHVLASDGTRPVGLDLGARADFRQARARPDARQLSLSPPGPAAAASDVSAMTMTLPVAAVDGSFAGAITATLDPDYLRILLRAALYTPDAWAGVAHGDGLVVMIEPHDDKVVGANIDQPGSFFRRHLDTGQPGSLLTGAVATNQQQRMMALRTVRPAELALDKPIVVAVSRNLEAMFAPWWRQTGADALLYLLLTAATSLALRSIQRRQRAIDQLEAQREEAARKSAERLELALRGADLGLWDYDLRTGTTIVNERWSSMLGLPQAQASPGLDIWRARVHPDDWPRVIAAQQAHLDGHGERFEATYRMRHADGRWLWILDRGQVLERDAQGLPLRMLGTHMDITERMDEQLALQRSEQSLATTLYSIGDAVIATDPQGLVVRMNATAERLTGWAAAAAIGQPLARVFQIVNARTRVPTVDPVHQVIAHGEVVALANDTLLLARDGHEYQIADSAAPIRTPDGEITGVVLVFSDVTERYRVQQALRANEERLRSLLENLGAGVIVHGPDSEVLDANPAAVRIIGLTIEQMRGKVSIDPYWAFLEEDGSPMPHERFPVPQVLASGGPVKSLVLGVRRADLERPLWVIVNAYPVRVAEGKLDQIVVTFVDITERKQSEELHQALETQLREAQKIESIGTLAGGIAHDFNNILAAILGNVALAREEVAAGHPVTQSLDQINRAGLRARHLVQQILSFSRSDQRGFTLQPLGAVVAETLGLLRSTLPAAVRLDTVLPDMPLAVRGDGTQLQQVLLNLCTNAWHALPAQGGRIEVGFEQAVLDESQRQRVPGLPPGRCVHLWVRDNGSGIDEATRQRIFDPFFTTKTVGQGTGLGLSVVHGIVRAHQGAIALDTAPGRGSTFHVYFPWPDAGTPQATTERTPAAGPQGAGQHVLYIDDDEVMVLLVERLLTRAGFRVTVDTDAVAAVARVQARPQAFDAVVTDFNMPEWSGLEVAARLARLRPGLPVVISSGFLSDALREQAAASGVRALMQKENTFDELAGLLQKLLATGAA